MDGWMDGLMDGWMDIECVSKRKKNTVKHKYPKRDQVGNMFYLGQIH